MTIDTIFNETELILFKRQTGFTFNDCYRSPDGTILAIDPESCQIFVGDDLLRSNVHAFGSLSSVDLEDGQIHLSFKDSSPVAITAGEGDADTIVAGLRDCLDAGPMPADSGDKQSSVTEEEQPLTGKEFNETYSRLINAGRNRALGYLVAEIGMSIQEANDYLDELEKKDTIDEYVSDPDFNRDGTMTRHAILKTVKMLKPGDRIHLEFKPLIGKLRVFDTEYLKLAIDVGDSKYFSLNVSDVDFNSLMEAAAEALYDNMDLFFFCEENQSEISCHLKRVKMLKII